MAVIVKGMKMPSKCIECPFWTIATEGSDFPFDYCFATKTVLDNTDMIPKDCPLEEAEVVTRSEVDDRDDIKEIVDYLNLVNGTAYRASTPKTRSLIRARMKEGFTVEDFKKVIDKKARDWNGNEKMQKYLRPETLFGTKFEGYLNEQEIYKLKGNRTSENSFQRIQRLMQEGAFEG